MFSENNIIIIIMIAITFVFFIEFVTLTYMN